MSRVVLRCPHCGTTQGVAGECETCHAGEVRYYCTNHTPGVWLDGPTCSRCGARFGEAPVEYPTSPPPAPPPRPPVRPRHDIGAPRPRSSDGTSRVPRVPPPRIPAPDETPDSPPALADVLFEMIEEGRRKRARTETVWIPSGPTGTTRGRSPLLGCLGRLVLLVIVIILLGLGGLFLLLGGALS